MISYSIVRKCGPPNESRTGSTVGKRDRSFQKCSFFVVPKMAQRTKLSLARRHPPPVRSLWRGCRTVPARGVGSHKRALKLRKLHDYLESSAQKRLLRVPRPILCLLFLSDGRYHQWDARLLRRTNRRVEHSARRQNATQLRKDCSCCAQLVVFAGVTLHRKRSNTSDQSWRAPGRSLRLQLKRVP